MKCPNCGEIIKSKKNQMNFCGFCGANLKTGEKAWMSTDSKSLLSVNNSEQSAIQYDSSASQQDIQTTQPSIQPFDHTSIPKPNPQTVQFYSQKLASQAAQPPIQNITPVQPDADDCSTIITPPNINSYESEEESIKTFIDSQSPEANNIYTNFQQDVPNYESAKSGSLEKISKNAFEHVINVPQRNIEIHSSSDPDSSSENAITYMEYTKSSKEIIEESASSFDNKPEENKFSSLEFPSEVSSSSHAEEKVEIPVEPEKPRTEKIINFIGQNKSTAEGTLSLKGLKPDFIYVTDNTNYDTIIAQSIEADTDVLPETSITLTVSAGTWTEWSENQIVPSSQYISELKTVYRKRSRTRTIDKRDTSNISEFEDYKLVGTTYKYSEWVNDLYYTSDVLKPNNTCEVISKVTGFKYAGWFDSVNSINLSFSSPDVANFFNNHLSNANWQYIEVVSEQNVKPDVKNWRLANDSMSKTPAGDSLTSNIFLSTHVINGKSYAMKFGSSETEWFMYKRRSIKETIYHFEKEIVSDWSDWNDWDECSDQAFTPSEDIEVEQKILTRSRRKCSSDK